MSDLILDGRVAVVTGAATGIGEGSALALARAGASVVLADLDDARPVADEIIAAGGKAAVTRCDIADEDQVAAVMAVAVETFGRLDILHANAGLGHGQARLTDIDKKAWDRTVSVNLTGTWLCLRHAARAMIEQGRGGSIVVTASATGLVGFPLTGGYAATKAGLISLTKTASMELAEAGIRVNAVAPGPIATDMVQKAIAARPELEDELRRSVPLGRPGAVEEVAHTVVWLCSSQASYITGTTVPVDGGQVAG
ncbi:SDR family oxidoreductase [Actinomadura sp. LD22]|uniref:SDR family oxidoreductase n=1 Tax=Actinomadura physcomitrii TaxID=2650748 RepID=A0A6I4MB26_9ACTN|nr:SDR family NAD(P)-dependent oxidoreductase [Actinomadura physcomitrii]MVZ99848.1 SDR family oxidoreductase [Actinomadura physcomitrii]